MTIVKSFLFNSIKLNDADCYTVQSNHDWTATLSFLLTFIVFLWLCVMFFCLLCFLVSMCFVEHQLILL